MAQSTLQTAGSIVRFRTTDSSTVDGIHSPQLNVDRKAVHRHCFDHPHRPACDEDRVQRLLRQTWVHGNVNRWVSDIAQAITGTVVKTTGTATPASGTYQCTPPTVW